MRRLFIILFCVTIVSSSWSQKIKYRISNGLQIEGVSSDNPIIYDNDMVEDTPEDQLLWLKYHHGEINLVGNIVTRNMDKCNTGPCKYSMQQTMDQWNKAAAGIKSAGFKMLAPVAGSSEMIAVPSSQRIEDTKWKSSAGADLIIREALKASKEKPLVIIIGGQATTVANAYLKNRSIADRIVVLHVNGYRDAPKARGFNTIDAWSAYVVMTNMRYVNFTGDHYTWYKNKNVNLTQSMVNSLPNDHMSSAVKSWYTRFFRLESFADAPPVLYLFKPSLWKNAVRKLKNGQTTTSDNFDYLLVSENDWTAYGPTYIDLMKNAGSQKSKPVVTVSSVKISAATVQLKTGATSQLTKVISPSNASNQNVSWTSSNTAIATVSATGLVTAKSAGTTQITVKTADGNKTSASTATVSAAAVAVKTVSVSPLTVKLSINGTSQLSAAVAPDNAASKSVKWSSSNQGVATVSTNGLVTGKAAGSAVITCTTTDGGKTATSAITVAAAAVKVSSITVTPSTLSLSVNGTSKLSATLNPANATEKGVKWSSSDQAIATVTSDGVVTAKAAGTAVITGASVEGDKVSKATVTIAAAQTAGVVDLDNAKRGSSVNQFNFSGTGWTHASATNDPYHEQTVSFSKIAGNSATVSFSGNKVELYSAKASHHGIVAVSIDNGPETMVDLYAASRQNFALVYGSAELSQGTHIIKMRVTGNKNSASNDGYVILDYLKIYSGESKAVSSVSISPASLTIGVDEKGQLSKSSSPATQEDLTWSSNNSSVAVVSASGLVTGVSNGTATITAKTTDGSKTATATVTVTSPSHASDFDNADRGTAQNKFNFSGSGWTHSTNTSDPYLNKTVSFSNITNEEVTITFVGNKVEFYTSKASHHGIVAISVDNGAEKMVDLYASSRQNYMMAFSSESLPQAEHTIKIRVTGTKNNSSTGTYAIVDYIKVYSTATGGGAGASAMMAEEETTLPIEYYPNPLRPGDVLHVNLPDAEGEVSLLDLAGVPQMTFPVTDKALAIPTDGLYKGIYLLQYRTAKGREVVKIMVQ